MWMEGRAAGEDSGKTGFSVCPGQKSLRQEQGGLVHSFFTMKLILPKATGTSTLCFLFLPQFPLGEEKKKNPGKRSFHPCYSYSTCGVVSLAKGSRGGGLVRVRPASTGEHKKSLSSVPSEQTRWRAAKQHLAAHQECHICKDRAVPGEQRAHTAEQRHMQHLSLCPPPCRPPSHSPQLLRHFPWFPCPI